MAIYGKPASEEKKELENSSVLTFNTKRITPDFRLLNGKQNEPYCQELIFDTENYLIEIIDINVTSCAGLAFDADSLKVMGSPLHNGEFDIVVTYYDKNDGFYENGPLENSVIDNQNNASIEQESAHSESILSDTDLYKTSVIKLYINPDPRNLWQNLPSNPADDYYKPDTVTKLFKVLDSDKSKNFVKTLLAARIRGRSHAHNGTCCDDDFFINRLQNNWHLTVVADGAGSALFSRKGSALATYEAGCSLTDKLEKSSYSNRLEMVVTNFIKQLSLNAKTEYGEENTNTAYWHSKEFENEFSSTSNDEAKLSGKLTLEHNLLLDEVIELVGGAAKAAIASHERFITTPEAKINNITLQDLSTTLMIVISKYIEGRWFIASFSVGDGVIGVFSEGQGLQILSSQDGGEFAGQTHFLTEEHILPESLRLRCQYMFIEEYTAILAMTDGVSDPIFETDNMIYDLSKWESFWSEIQANVLNQAELEFALAKYLNFWSKGHHDDRTLALQF
ncbi:PP2C family serine/threonine-protein phosphatase [Thorsellia anophelis]|uniref:Protein phosphatase 2C n=1 Tax=Thorsellia anophelis DSM 18579 TaxID=1123402 RepID=A0A1I0ENX5_9GAMM|nr:PP2C family serine/threonine-protein phosphatase [Thorsellia anophelis]SET46979.1 Protein phosphatase 2C [Thorsellia anophelis DSM 18579]